MEYLAVGVDVCADGAEDWDFEEGFAVFLRDVEDGGPGSPTFRTDD